MQFLWENKVKSYLGYPTVGIYIKMSLYNNIILKGDKST